MEAEVRAISEERSNAIIHQDEGVEEVTGRLKAANARLREAKQAHKDAKAGKEEEVGGGEGGGGEVGGGGNGGGGTSRQLSRQLSMEEGRRRAAANDAKRLKVEEAREAVREAVRRRQLQSELRVTRVGKDRNGGTYWMATEAEEEDDDDSEDDDGGDGGAAGDRGDGCRCQGRRRPPIAMLLVEDASGVWGEVLSIRRLRTALNESEHYDDVRLKEYWSVPGRRRRWGWWWWGGGEGEARLPQRHRRRREVEVVVMVCAVPLPKATC